MSRRVPAYAAPAVTRLREQAIAADAIAMGKGHNFYGAALKIESDLMPRWGDTPITAMSENDLNDWIADQYRVEDAEATVARYGGQPKGEGRQEVWKKPAQPRWVIWIGRSASLDGGGRREGRGSSASTDDPPRAWRSR